MQRLHLARQPDPHPRPVLGEAQQPVLGRLALVSHGCGAVLPVGGEVEELRHAWGEAWHREA
eukprot:scaffold120714_cov69-Phaeocystis_antarctica.AAC.4